MNLRDELQSIYDQHGELTPTLVVEAARPRGAPLHAMVFNRNRKEAAEVYYLLRARELIRSVKVIYREADENGPDRSVRKWHAIRTPNGNVYRPAEDIADDPFARTLLLREMERDWKLLLSRFAAFEEFSSMVARDLQIAV